MAKKKVVKEPDTVGEVTVETIEVKSLMSEPEVQLKVADLNPKAVPAMKPYDQKTVQVETRETKTLHFNKTIVRKDFK